MKSLEPLGIAVGLSIGLFLITMVAINDIPWFYFADWASIAFLYGMYRWYKRCFHKACKQDFQNKIYGSTKLKWYGFT